MDNEIIPIMVPIFFFAAVLKNEYLQMFSSYGDILTVNEVAEILLIGRNHVYAMLRSGELTGFRMGKNTWRIPKKNLEVYILQKCRKRYAGCD